MKLSVIIPCYNESGNLKILFECLTKVVSGRSIEIIFVDNGSTDNSNEVFEQLLEKTDSNVFKLHTVKENQGYGYGILSGLSVALGEVLAWTHADLQTDPFDVIRALELFEKSDGNIIIKGKRLKRKISDRIFTLGMQIAVLLLLKTNLNDINAQPKLFSRDFYTKFLLDNSPYDFSLDLFLLYQAKINGYGIETVPVRFNDRLYGVAKGGGGSNLKTRLKLIKRTFSYILHLRNYLRKTKGVIA
jgi:glycosyltransferase involved in cell wall biosynthesis